jgi:hypothetical protein
MSAPEIDVAELIGHLQRDCERVSCAGNCRTCYTRDARIMLAYLADLHDTLRAERDALAERVERLEGALRTIQRQMDYPQHYRRVIDEACSAALSTA